MIKLQNKRTVTSEASSKEKLLDDYVHYGRAICRRVPMVFSVDFGFDEALALTAGLAARQRGTRLVSRVPML